MASREAATDSHHLALGHQSRVKCLWSGTLNLLLVLATSPFPMKSMPRSLSVLVFYSVLASCGGSGGSTVTPPPAVASVKVTVPSTLVEGQTSQALATPLDAGGQSLSGRSVTWASSDGLVATVTAGGLITAIKPGTATISATSEGQVGSSALAVSIDPTPASIVLTPPTLSITSGGSLQVTSVVKNGRGEVVSAQGLTYASSAPNIATVSSAGLVSSVGPVGAANITATIGATVSAPAVVTVVTGAATAASPKPGTQNQTAPAGTNVANSPAVVVTDAYGNPVVGVNVIFSTASNGTGQLAIVPTNSAGVAQLAIPWKLSTTPGPNYYYANVGSFPQIVFTATGT